MWTAERDFIARPPVELTYFELTYFTNVNAKIVPSLYLETAAATTRAPGGHDWARLIKPAGPRLSPS